MKKRVNKKFVGYFKSPVGWLRIEVSKMGLMGIEFVYKKGKKSEKQVWITEVKKQLSEYFEGKRKRFELPLDVEGTIFQERVWRVLRKIPFGETVSYADIAAKIGQPKAVRAVGNANGKNPVPIVVPCHRVIASNGTIGGYSSGIDRKTWLLEFEEKLTPKVG